MNADAKIIARIIFVFQLLVTAVCLAAAHNLAGAGDLSLAVFASVVGCWMLWSSVTGWRNIEKLIRDRDAMAAREDEHRKK